MRYIDYVDILPIPEKLLATKEYILDVYKNQRINYPGINNNYFYSLTVPNDLKNWCHDNLSFDIASIRYQYIPGNLPIHKDIDNRIIAFNYNIEIGGDSVFTSIYDEDKTTLLHRCSISNKKWHFIKTGFFHDVTGVVNGRINLSVSPTHDEQKRLFKLY